MYYICVYIYIYIYIYATHALEQMMYDYAHLASVRFEYSVCRWSIMYIYVYILIYNIYMYINIYIYTY